MWCIELTAEGVSIFMSISTVRVVEKLPTGKK